MSSVNRSVSRTQREKISNQKHLCGLCQVVFRQGRGKEGGGASVGSNGNNVQLGLCAGRFVPVSWSTRTEALKCGVREGEKLTTLIASVCWLCLLPTSHSNDYHCGFRPGSCVWTSTHVDLSSLLHHSLVHLSGLQTNHRACILICCEVGC